MTIDTHANRHTERLRKAPSHSVAWQNAIAALEGISAYLAEMYGDHQAAEILFNYADHYSVDPELRALPPNAPGNGAAFE